MTRKYDFFKRIIDVALALSALIFLSPFFIIISALIVITSGFPVFYRQERIGRNWRKFHILKFRTMVKNADRIGPALSASLDNRITPVGKFLRKYKLDELPQLINVIKGEMSIVGPRPEVMKYIEFYKNEYDDILRVRPGISDYASIEYRNESELLNRSLDPEDYYIKNLLPQKIQLYFKYIENKSFLTDINIIISTIRVILGLKATSSDTIPLSGFKRKAVFILLDIAAFSASLLLSLQIRFNFDQNAIPAGSLIYYLAVFSAVKISVYFYFRLYNISWRFVSLHELANIAKACVLSSGLLFVFIYGSSSGIFAGFSRSVLLMDLVLGFLFSAGLKISRRMYIEVVRKSNNNPNLQRTLIVGAGCTGEQLLRDLNRSYDRRINPVGFVDDDPKKQNIFVQGVKVLGTTAEIPSIIKFFNVDSVIIAVLSAGNAFHKKINLIARECGVRDVKVVSKINDVSNQIQVGVRDIRDIDVSDLIGRQAVSINTKEISSYIRDKRVLITGAAGSIGSEIAKQICLYSPSQVGILDINESDLAGLELELKHSYPGIQTKMFLCDISIDDKVSRIFDGFRPNVVFHAAAYKHVPVMEKYPEEAVRVNIIGTYNLTRAAQRVNTDHFVLISTDKAVKPSSIMGVTKRIAEIIVTNAGMNNDSSFLAVRFGNVIGSRGSVLPIFLDQIKNGGPLTITHPEMKRYFMTIPEAVALVLQAAATGQNRDVFVLDMGEPVKIVDLARELILLNNLVPNKDVKIVYTGIREGEKLFEEILTAEEGVLSTRHEKIFKAKMSDKVYEISEIISSCQQLGNNASKSEWIELFRELVPTFNVELKDHVYYIGEANQHYRGQTLVG